MPLAIQAEIASISSSIARQSDQELAGSRPCCWAWDDQCARISAAERPLRSVGPATGTG